MTWDWTQVVRTLDEHSTRSANEPDLLVNILVWKNLPGDVVEALIFNKQHSWRFSFWVKEFIKNILRFWVKYEAHTISFQTFFVWALLLIVNTWNSSPLQSNLLRLQCTCCTAPTTSARPHRGPLVWACQWLSSQPLSSPQFSHNDSLWA